MPLTESDGWLDGIDDADLIDLASINMQELVHTLGIEQDDAPQVSCEAKSQGSVSFTSDDILDAVMGVSDGCPLG